MEINEGKTENERKMKEGGKQEENGETGSGEKNWRN